MANTYVGVGRDLLCDPQNLENENEGSKSHEKID
jgi:hypothetical protein